VTPFDHARTIVDSYAALLRSELPKDAYLFDVHTHLGHDIDGMNGYYEELTVGLDRYGFSGAFTFCMDEYDREPAFTVPNDRTLEHAERAGGTLIPFVRLDLTERPFEEACRCLDLGARGIKLHPRAQAFALDDERLPPIFELAVERNVPILIHGGRGLPPIAEHLGFPAIPEGEIHEELLLAVDRISEVDDFVAVDDRGSVIEQGLAPLTDGPTHTQTVQLPVRDPVQGIEVDPIVPDEIVGFAIERLDNVAAKRNRDKKKHLTGKVRNF